MGTINGFNTNQTYYPGPEFNDAMKLIQSLIQDHYSDDSSHIKASIQFLGLAASNEQQKEIDSIREIFNEFKKELKLEDDKSELAKALKKSPDEVINNPTEFYKELILAINHDRQGFEDTKKSINRIQQNIQKARLNKRNVKDYYNTDARFAAQYNLTDFMKNIMGESQIDENKFSSQLTRIALETLIDLGIVNKLKSGEDFMAAAAGLLTDLSLRAQESLDRLLQTKKDATFDSLGESVIQDLKTKYIDEVKKNKETTEMQTLLSDIRNDINSPELQLGLSNIKKILGIRMNSTDMAIQRLNQLQEKSLFEENEIDATINKFTEIVKTNIPLSQSLYTITFTSMEKSNSAFGDINEMVQGLIKKKISENVATDLVSYRFNFKLDKNKQAMADFLKGIDNSLSSTMKKKDSRNIQQMTESLETMNKELIGIQNKMEQLIKKEDQLSNKKLFIYHESLKLSSQAETKANHDFKGRTMSILSFIASLNSMNSGLSQNENLTAAQVDANELEFLAYNLFPGSAGNNDQFSAIGPLEKYFSIFAGILMFDDISNITMEAATKTQSLSNSKSVEQIHLYNLNGVYVPASLLLSSMHQLLTGIATDIEAGMVAKASIIFQSKIKNEKATSFKQRLADQKGRISEILVRITFLAGFMQLIDSLFNMIK